IKMKIELINVSKTLNQIEVLKSITTTFESGNVYGLFGRNGSGKTMLLRCISGLIAPTVGEVIVDGLNLAESHSFLPDAGILLEEPKLLPYLSGLDNLELLASINKKIDREEIKKWLVQFDLDPTDKRKTKKYSQGMRQKIGIIQAMMENQQVILLDEPFNALDVQSSGVLIEVIHSLRDQNKTIIVTSHEMDYLTAVCDIILRMEDGRIIN
ncbi:MAG TPA: ABC transporter ATP-binding protein, partial [Tissierellia bacterium]|nr:ABC transporter ATP-binding protein [Tissierellia bacterium]